VVNISSEYGSVSDNRDGFPYYYAASKAALNMLTRSLAADARRARLVAVVLDPGWVSTEMGGPGAPLTRVGPRPGRAGGSRLGALGMVLEVLAHRVEEEAERFLLGASGHAHVGVGDRGGPKDAALFLDEIDLDPHATPPRDGRARSARKR
jgi:NAD(P)-dependent dehydrogenase (short-subunit alcohol dehydrogenase family)